MSDKTDQKPENDDKMTAAETAGYIGGNVFFGLQMFAPVRMWILLLASIIFLVRVFTLTETRGAVDPDNIPSLVRAFAVYLVFVALLLGTGAFRKRKK